MILRWLTISALIVLAGCVGSDRTPEPTLVVGAVLPLSGPDFVAGERLLAGLEIAAASADAPFRIEIRPVDGAGDPAGSVRRARDLAADPAVLAIVGGWSPATARPLAATLARRNVPFVALSARAGAPHAPVGLTVLHGVDALGAAAARYAHEALGSTLAAVIRDPGSSASRELAAAFERELVDRGAEVAWTVDLDGEGRPLRPRGPEPAVDVLFAATSAGVVGAVGPFGRRVSESPVLLTDGWDLAAAPALVEEGRSVFVVSFWAEDDCSPEALDLAEVLAATGVGPSVATAFGWDAIVLLRTAAGEGGLDRAGIGAALGAGLSVNGATGRLAGAGLAGRVETPAVSEIDGAGRKLLTRLEIVTGRAPEPSPSP